MPAIRYRGNAVLRIANNSPGDWVDVVKKNEEVRVPWLGFVSREQALSMGGVPVRIPVVAITATDGIGIIDKKEWIDAKFIQGCLMRYNVGSQRAAVFGIEKDGLPRTLAPKSLD